MDICAGKERLSAIAACASPVQLGRDGYVSCTFHNHTEA
jgi:hypothetical protein